MKLAPLQTNVRLIAGYVLVLAVFATAALLSMIYFEQIVDTAKEITRLQRGREASLQVETQAGKMDAAMADLMLSGDLSHVNAFQEATREMGEARSRISQAIPHGDTQKRELLARVETLSRRVESRFNDRFVSAVIARDQDVVWQQRQQCREDLDTLRRLNLKITRSLEREISRITNKADDLRNNAQRDIGLLLAMAVVLAVVVGFITARSISQPIHELMTATQAVASGDLSRRLDDDRGDEFGRLAASFNRMSADLQQHQQRLVQAEKMASLGRLAAGVAHEINNPIGVILGYAKVLRNEDLAPEIDEDLKVIEEEAEQCQHIVQGLLNFSRAAPAPDEVVDVRQVVSDVLQRIRRRPESANVEIVEHVPQQQVPVLVDYNRLRQAMENIARNAVEAMSSGGTLDIEIRRVELPGEKPSAVAVFSDNGPGVPAPLQARLFEPFFTTKESGTGLGLAIAYAGVRAYGGEITVESEVGLGTTFRITLPLAEGEPTA